MDEITLLATDALDLQDLHARHMTASTRGKGFSVSEESLTLSKFSEKAQSLGISRILVAERIANTVWLNYRAIEELAKLPGAKVTIPYDMASDWLRRIA